MSNRPDLATAKKRTEKFLETKVKDLVSTQQAEYLCDKTILVPTVEWISRADRNVGDEIGYDPRDSNEISFDAKIFSLKDYLEVVAHSKLFEQFLTPEFREELKHSCPEQYAAYTNDTNEVLQNRYKVSGALTNHREFIAQLIRFAKNGTPPEKAILRKEFQLISAVQSELQSANNNATCPDSIKESFYISKASKILCDYTYDKFLEKNPANTSLPSMRSSNDLPDYIIQNKDIEDMMQRYVNTGLDYDLRQVLKKMIKQAIITSIKDNDPYIAPSELKEHESKLLDHYDKKNADIDLLNHVKQFIAELAMDLKLDLNPQRGRRP